MTISRSEIETTVRWSPTVPGVAGVGRLDPASLNIATVNPGLVELTAKLVNTGRVCGVSRETSLANRARGADHASAVDTVRSVGVARIAKTGEMPARVTAAWEVFPDVIGGCGGPEGYLRGESRIGDRRIDTDGMVG
ncbi:hypothetical protein [Microbacterium hydrocarbonoxydans]|uniref:hypothetical protein n=1 Tax=Microbacterium hydrocarbonoxydans TaxID=273678 RepID=UPI00203FF91D|nr:hypothetical protein [Microbacterium hydrocarbonoxydans]MCM3778652.1 hypothetical protein [Microbacterium hydrocarbonoxydans]